MRILEDLQINNIKIYQDVDLYRFTSDSVLLSNFVRVNPSELVVDFGTGSGIIPFLLIAKYNIRNVIGVELQKELYQMCSDSIKYNNLENKFELINCRIQDSFKKFKKHPDVIVCNPPYKKVGIGKLPKSESNKIAKFETEITLPEIIEAARRNLKVGGRLYMIHLADRLLDIISNLTRNDFALHRVQFVHSKKNLPAHLVMIEAINSGRCQSEILPPLILNE